MKLITEELRKQLPPLYSQENEKDPTIICRFFLPLTKWAWYVTEFDGKDTFFGFVSGEYPKLGYFTLSELENAEGPYGLGVERDMFFQPIKLSEVKKEFGENGDTINA